jgi:hypothetical protein
MSTKSRPSSTTRRAPSNGKVFVKIAGLWIAMICGSFLLGFGVVSPLMRAASPDKQPKDNSGSQPTPQTAQVNHETAPVRRAPGPAINIAPDEEPKQAIQEPETDVTTPQQQPDENGTNTDPQVQEPDNTESMSDSGATRRKLSGDDLSVESAPAPTTHRRSDRGGPEVQRAPEPGTRTRVNSETTPRSRSKQPVQKTDSID